MKNANDLMPVCRRCLKASSIFLLLELLHHVLAGFVGRRLDAHREHPAARRAQALHEVEVRQIVGARVAEPADIELPRDQLVAELAEALRVQRDGIGPQIEVRGRPSSFVARSISSTIALRIALAELVALMDRRHAEIARIRTAAAGLDDDVGLAFERQRVAASSGTRSHAGNGMFAKPVNTPCALCGDDRRFVEAIRQARDRVEPIRRELIEAGEGDDGVFGLADQHAVDLRGAGHRGLRRRRGVRSERDHRRLIFLAQLRHLRHVGVQRRRGRAEDDQVGREPARRRVCAMTWAVVRFAAVMSIRRKSRPRARSSDAVTSSEYGGFVVPRTSSRS